MKSNAIQNIYTDLTIIDQEGDDTVLDWTAMGIDPDQE